MKNITYLIVILFLITSCERNQTSEEKILTDIFPQLVDSLQIKWEPLPHQPPPLIFDKDSNFIGVDSIKMDLIISEHQKYLDRIDSIDSKILIGILDTCFFIDWDDLKSKTYSEDNLISKYKLLNERESNISKELNLSQINISSDFKLILKSEIKINNSNIWSILRDRKFAGLLEISKVYFSGNNDSGLLQIDYYYDQWNGYSYFVIIEKTDKEWQIKKLLRNWVT